MHAELQQGAAAEHDAEQRIGQPFRHAVSLADAENDLTRIETQLAAMQEDIDHAAPPEPTPQSPPSGLTVEMVRAHRAAFGVRANPTRAPSTNGAFTSTGGESRDLPPRGL